MMQRFREFLKSIVQRGQKAGQFRRDVDAAIAAEVYAGAIMGAEIQYYQDPEKIDLAATLAAFVEQYVGWLSARRQQHRRAAALPSAAPPPNVRQGGNSHGQFPT